MSYDYKTQDLFEFARATGADVHEKGNELYWKYCPYCGGDGKDKDTFSVNTESGAFNCFRASCGKHGHFVELARDFAFPLDFGETKQYRVLPQKEIAVRDKAIEYMASRGISAEVCKRYKITTRKDNERLIAFPFYDENNILQFVKYRNSQFKRGMPGNKEWCEKDTKPILFGMAQCVDFETLVITEGQIDSLSLAECGIKNATSVPTGAMGFTWLQNCWEWVCKFKRALVFGDWEKGKMSLLDTLQARLTQPVIAVRKEDYLGEKDANDILRKYGKDAIIKAVENAEPPKLSNVKDLSTVEAIDLNKLPKILTNIPEIDRVIGGMCFGQLVLLTGKRGEGKSTFMSQFVCEALDQQNNVFVYSGELADFHFKRWIDYQLAGSNNIITNKNAFGDDEYTLPAEVIQKLNNWYKGRAYIYDNSFVPDADAEMETLIDTVEKAIKQYNIKMVCIDNLMTAIDVEASDNVFLAQSAFVGKLKKIAVKYNVLVILIAHPRKSKDAFTNDDVSGSSDITNKVDIVLNYGRAKEDEDFDAILQITKNRLTGKLATGERKIELLYSQKTKRIFSESCRQRHYGWETSSWVNNKSEFDILPL